MLHSGRKSIVTEKPVEINTGITFKRMDLARTPKLVPSSESRGEVVRSISMVYGNTRVKIKEHLLAIIYARS